MLPEIAERCESSAETATPPIKPPVRRYRRRHPLPVANTGYLAASMFARRAASSSTVLLSSLCRITQSTISLCRRRPTSRNRFTSSRSRRATRRT